MQEDFASKITFKPSRALIPVAVVFLLLVIYLSYLILTLAPVVIVLVLLPVTVFSLWWFGSLLIHATKFQVNVDQNGLTVITSEGLFGSRAVRLEWKEIKSVRFGYENEINPRYFAGRNTTLTLFPLTGKEIQVHQVTTLENYGELFEAIQKKIPFAYALPKEHLWNDRSRQFIALALVALCVLMLIVLL